MERKMVDVTGEFKRMEAELFLIRHILGLKSYHSVVEAVRVLLNDGHDAFLQQLEPHAAANASDDPGSVA